MIIWAGYGYLVAVIAFGCSLLMEVATETYTGNDEFYQESGWAFPSALIIASVFVYISDRLIKPAPGVQNSLFFIPMKWWTPVLSLIAFTTIVYQMVSKAAG